MWKTENVTKPWLELRGRVQMKNNEVIGKLSCAVWFEKPQRDCVVDNERKVHSQMIGCSAMLEINFQACFSSYQPQISCFWPCDCKRMQQCSVVWEVCLQNEWQKKPVESTFTSTVFLSTNVIASLTGVNLCFGVQSTQCSKASLRYMTSVVHTAGQSYQQTKS